MPTEPAALAATHEKRTENPALDGPADDIQTQLRLAAGDALASLELAATQQRLGRLAEAEAACRQALEIDPNFARAHDCLGVLFFLSKRHEEAEAHLRRALECDPADDEAACNLNHLLVALGREDEAYARCEQRLPISAAPGMLLARLGIALKAANRLDAAESSYRRALEFDPDSLVALNNLAALLSDFDRLAEAETFARRGVAIAPGYPEVNLTLGAILDKLGLKEQSAAVYRRLLSLYPDSPEALCSLGHLAAVRHAYAEAEHYASRALALDPRLVRAHNTLALVQLMANRFGDAERTYQHALQIKPDDALTRFNLSLVQLMQGNFSEGWANWEARWDCVLRRHRRTFDAPCWDGGDLDGKTLLIHHEQGLGDTLQMIRYARLAAQRAGKVVVVVQKPLYRLLQGMAGVTVRTGMPRHYDAYCYTTSLPLKFGTTPDTIPAPAPYLGIPAAARERWSDLFVEADGMGPRKPRIGAVWAGLAQHLNDKNRSIPFESLASLFSIEGVQWVSLQKDRRPDELDDYVAERGWLDPMNEVEDYEDTAAIVDQLDLVICVDTSVAHLAGALGKTVWLLLPASPDWRWLLTHQTSSPWYPTMRLFRQECPEGWAPVIERVADALLAEFPAAHAPPRLTSSTTPLPNHGAEASPAPANDEVSPETCTAVADTGNAAWIARLQERYANCPFWYHRIALPGNITTPGWAPLNRDAYDLPERMDGLRVLDVGAWDGYWTFEALRRGAREVVAIDDLSDTLGVAPDHPWRDWRNFDVCREALGFDESVCQRKTLSVYDVSEESLGRFDVVLFFGVFNQLRDPLGALQKVAAVCDHSLYVEAAVADDYSPYRGGMNRGFAQGEMLMEYYPNGELGNARANQWAPTMRALAAMVHGLGFPEVEGWKLEEHPIRAAHCRGFVKGIREAEEQHPAPQMSVPGRS